MATDPHDPRPYEEMDNAALLTSYLSYRTTARRARGSDWLWDQNRTLVCYGVLRARGLAVAVERGVQLMKESKWLALPADVAREVLAAKGAEA